MESNHQVVFLVGAARSGTKMLREILEQSEDIGVIPYDMNYIWKYGHYDLKHDEMNHIEPTNNEINFITNFINKKIKQSQTPILIEKTVSNSMRIDYIKKIFPNAKIIHLFRDGRDVSLSAKKRWEGTAFDSEQQSKKDILKKIIDLPVLAVLPYLVEYAKSNLKHLLSRESSHIESWGPVYKELEKDKKELSLLEICAKQWKRSVELALESLEKYTYNKDYINIQYEQLLENPKKEIENISVFLDIKDKNKLIEYANKEIRNNNQNKWKKLNLENQNKLNDILTPTLKKLDYEI